MRLPSYRTWTVFSFYNSFLKPNPLPCPSPFKKNPTIILILTLVHPAGASRTLKAKTYAPKVLKNKKNKTNTPNLQQVDSLIETETESSKIHWLVFVW